MTAHDLLEHHATVAAADVLNDDTGAVKLRPQSFGICFLHCLRVSEQHRVITIVVFLMRCLVCGFVLHTSPLQSLMM